MVGFLDFAEDGSVEALLRSLAGGLYPEAALNGELDHLAGVHGPAFGLEDFDGGIQERHLPGPWRFGRWLGGWRFGLLKLILGLIQQDVG